MLRAVTGRQILPNLLLLLRREAAAPAWQPNALLCVAVALNMALVASVPLSPLFEPRGALASPDRHAAGGPHGAVRQRRQLAPAVALLREPQARAERMAGRR